MLVDIGHFEFALIIINIWLIVLTKILFFLFYILFFLKLIRTKKLNLGLIKISFRQDFNTPQIIIKAAFYSE